MLRSERSRHPPGILELESEEKNQTHVTYSGVHVFLVLPGVIKAELYFLSTLANIAYVYEEILKLIYMNLLGNSELLTVGQTDKHTGGNIKDGQI